MVNRGQFLHSIWKRISSSPAFLTQTSWFSSLTVYKHITQCQKAEVCIFTSQPCTALHKYTLWLLRSFFLNGLNWSSRTILLTKLLFGDTLVLSPHRPIPPCYTAVLWNVCQHCFHNKAPAIFVLLINIHSKQGESDRHQVPKFGQYWTNIVGACFKWMPQN